MVVRHAWRRACSRPRASRVEAREIPHKGGRTFGYRVSDGHSAIAYIPDHCPTALGPGPEGWGEYHPGALALAAGVDLLIHGAFRWPDEVAAEASFGHSPAPDTAPEPPPWHASPGIRPTGTPFSVIQATVP